MEAKDFISAAAIVASTLIAVRGWAAGAEKDRKQHLFQKRLERRFGMFDDFIAAVVPLMNYPAPLDADPLLLQKLAKARLSVQLYGYSEEQLMYEELVAALEKSDLALTNKALSSLVSHIRMKLREEMGFPPKISRK